MRAAPLLALLVFARPATGGICWTGMDRGGRCSSVFQERMGRTECCTRAPHAAWSPADLDSGKVFFLKTLGGGVPCSPCAESCEGMQCGAGRRCVVRKGRARCVCGARCAGAGPVCGSDGRTYRSLCRLRRRACRRPAAHLTLDYHGACQVGRCEAVRCGAGKVCVVDAELGVHCVRCGGCAGGGGALCAADGRTYAGPCALRTAACLAGRALPLAYRGPCIANATCSMVRCSAGQKCVSGGPSGARCVTCGGCARGGRRALCASDGRTYPSWCRLQRAVCDRGSLLDVVHAGHCEGNQTAGGESIEDEPQLQKYS